jgi:hypothetical protein
MIINMFERVGDFGEDKDIAAALREEFIKPTVARGCAITLDFDGVTLVTQSFIHALISNVLRASGENVLDLIEFKHCAEVVRGIISTVVQYSLDTMTDEFSESIETKPQSSEPS